MPKEPRPPERQAYPPLRFEDGAAAQAAAIECLQDGRVDIFEEKVKAHGLNMKEAKAIVAHGKTRISKEHEFRYEAFSYVPSKGVCCAAYEILLMPFGQNLQIITAYPLQNTEDRFR